MIWARRSATIGLSATSILLCLLISTEISPGPRDDASSPVAAQIPLSTRDHLADAPGGADHRAKWLNEILARPLFSPTRRPVETTVSGLPRLTGIVMTGSERVAIFAAPGNDHPIVARAGARVGAYEVQSIGDEGVTVAGPTGITLIRPIFDVARPATPAPSGTPGARPVPARPAGR
jgi:hypothetical protein